MKKISHLGLMVLLTLILGAWGGGKQSVEEKLVDRNKENSEEAYIREVLGKKLDLLGSFSNSLMLWWVSSILFIGSAIGATFVYSDKLANIGNWSHVYYSLGCSFTVCVAIFGFVTRRQLYKAEQEFQELLNLFGSKISVPIEFKIVRYGSLFGSVMFLVLAIAWIFLWFIPGTPITSPLSTKALSFY